MSELPKPTCESCVPRDFYGGYKDVLLCERHKNVQILEASLSKSQAEVKELTKTIEDRGHAFQDAINRALLERNDLWGQVASLKVEVNKLTEALQEVSRLEFIVSEEATQNRKDRDSWKALAEKMAEALKYYSKYQPYSSSRLAKEALQSYEKREG